MIPNMILKNILDEFAYRLNKKHNFIIEPGFFDYTVPFAGFAYDNSIPSSIIDALKRDGIMYNPEDNLVAVLSDWDNGAKGIYLTIDEIIVRTSRNIEEKFRINYDNIREMEYYFIDNRYVLKIYEHYGSSHKININTFDRLNIMIFLKIASGFKKLESREMERAGSIKLSSLKGKAVYDIVTGAFINNQADIKEWLSEIPRLRRMELVHNNVFNPSDSKLLENCLHIMENDNYCIKNLPLDEEIKQILSKQPVFRMNKNDKYIWYADSKYMDEPSIVTLSVEEFKEYGFKKISLIMYPKAIYTCLAMAASIQNLKNSHLSNIETREVLIKERNDLIKAIGNLENERNTLADDFCKMAKIDIKELEKFISNSNSMVKKAALGISNSTKIMSLNPIGGLIVTAGLLCWANDRKKVNIARGIQEGADFFDKILIDLNVEFNKHEVECKQCIYEDEKEIQARCKQINNLQLAKSILENKISALNSLIALEKG